MTIKKKTLVWSLTALLCATGAQAAELGVDWGRRDGISVPPGSEETQSDCVLVSDGGTFVKTGEGKLVLPLEKLKSAASISVEVTDGAVELQPGVPAAGSAVAPSFVTDKAAFWVDAGADNGSIVVEGSTVKRWCDRRETSVDAPTRYNARPATADNAGTVELDQTVVETSAGKSVYFGGYNRENKRYMQFYAGASETRAILGIRHAFVVFGVESCYNGPLGSASNPDDWFSSSAVQDMSTASPKYMDIEYGEASPAAFSGRHYLDGIRFDPWSTPVKKGFHLWETHFLDYVGSAGNFFNHKGSKTRQGGDYISEVILFTNDLTSVERLQVQEYLLSKWSLASATRGVRDVKFELASGSTAEIEAAAAVEYPTSSVTRLSGVGVLKKSGDGELTIDHKSLSVEDYEGDMELSGGDLFVRRGGIPAFRLAAGETVFFGMKDRSGATAKTIDGYEKYGFGASKTSGGKSGVVTKQGAESVRIHSLPEDVKQLCVQEGELALTAQSCGNLVPGAPIYVKVPNGDFEECFTPDKSYNVCSLKTNVASNHWYGTGGKNNGVTGFIAENYSASDTGAGGHSRGTFCSYPIRQGSNALAVFNNGYAYTENVVFPKSGYYEMTLLESSRYHCAEVGPTHSYYLSNPGYEVKIGEDWASARTVASRALANAGDFVEVKISLGFIEAGTKVLGFKGPDWSTATTLILDDIRICSVAERQGLGLVKIPNGDFENITNATIAAEGGKNNQAMYPARTSTNEAIGWTFENSDSDCPAAAVVSAYCSPTTSADNNTAKWGSELMPYGDHADGSLGSTFLSLCGNAGSAKTRFSVPAGVYRLCGRIAKWSGKHNSKQFRDASVTVEATVTVDGQTISLGMVSTESHRLIECSWPTVFEVEEEDEVELCVAESSPTGAALLDDLVLESVAAGNGRERELVINGSFESEGGADGGATLSGWTKFNSTSDYGPNQAPSVINPQYDYETTPKNQTPQQFGWIAYDGVAYARIVNNSGIYQSLTLDPGVYRLSFAAHSRVNSGYGQNPIRAWLGDSSGNLVVDIGETPVMSVADIVHTWYFRVTMTGTYRLYLQGTEFWKAQYQVDGCAHTSIIDGVSLKKLRDELSSPVLPDTLKLVVDAGARLRLDYDGTVEVGRLSLGGTAVRGIVDATTHPEYVRGRGVLNVTGKGVPGCVLIVR